MNLLHMKYAVVVAETNSINKAAELLYVGQPTLSRAIKELESSLGVTLFERSAKGMFLTPDGETFVRYAKTVLEQVDSIEDLFKNTGLHYRTTEYIREEMWSKFRLNVCNNLPQAILGVGVGCYQDSVHMKQISNGLRQELEAIAAAKGIPTPYNEYTYHIIKALEEKNDGKFDYSKDKGQMTCAK